jgi:hypothetical protein
MIRGLSSSASTAVARDFLLPAAQWILIRLYLSKTKSCRKPPGRKEGKAQRTVRDYGPPRGAAYGPAPLPPTCAAWRRGERARDAARWDAPVGVTSMARARGGAEWRSRRAARQANGGKVCEPAGCEEGARFWQRGGGARAGATRSERTTASAPSSSYDEETGSPCYTS